MELIYSVRRKPIKCEPPHYDGTTDPEIVRPICKISICNIIAFSSLTELTDCDGDTWGGHVYVCDLDTPWDSHKVTSTIHPVSALEWDGEGKQLLVATTVGEVSIFGQKDFLLNEWTCLYSASFPGEHIIAATFFHNGRRIVVVDKKPDAPICERIQQLRPAPTLKGFGGAACAGVLVVSGSGLVGAVAAGEGAALVSADCMRAARDHVTAAHIAHKNGAVLIAAAYRRGARRGVRCARVSLSRTGAPRSAPAVITLSPLPTVYLGDDICPASISWWIRDDGDCLLIAGNNLTLWKLTERSYPVHKLLSKGPVQGSTTPGGGPKTNDCFTTLCWQQSATWQLEGTEPASHVVVPPHALSTAVVVTPRALHLLARDTPHYLICRPIVTSGAIAPEVSSGAGTPPKKPKYGPGALPGGVGGVSDVWCAAVSALGGAVLALDARAQLYLYKLHSAAADMPTALSVQHVISLLEYSMVSGYDSLDVLMTLKSNLIEAVYERLTENFQRQPQSFQQYYYQSWLKLRIALCSLSPSPALSASGASLSSLQMCSAVWAACLAALRDERLDGLLEDSGEGDKNLLALEAKADLSDSTLQALQPLQALRRPLQRALHTALTALAALPASLHQMQHGYELWSDPAALAVLRRLVVAARACGRGGDALSRPLARLAAAAPPAHSGLKADLVEECALVSGAAAARVWDALPRCCVAAPHARSLPLHFEFGIEPEYLRYVPEPPAYAQSDITPALDMDSIRYMYLGGGRRRARWRQCGRCGARALPAAQPSRHPLQRAYDGRFVAACRCGGKWTLVSNV